MTFLELINHLERIPDDIRQIKGIAYFHQGEYVQTETRPVIDDLDTIPIPDRSLIDQRDFVGIQYSIARPNTEMVITRGCPLRCVFCANPVFRLQNGPTFRCRSPQSIAEEAEYLYGLGYREIYLHSDELNVSLDWSIEVCKALAGLHHPDLFFQCNLRVVPLNEELAHWLKSANFWMVKFGIESSSDRVLHGIKKMMSQEKTIRACELTAKAGIKVYGFFMLYQMWEDRREGSVRNARGSQSYHRFCPAVVEERHPALHHLGFCNSRSRCRTLRHRPAAWDDRRELLPVR